MVVLERFDQAVGYEAIEGTIELDGIGPGRA
jgi:hypothetical protein